MVIASCTHGLRIAWYRSVPAFYEPDDDHETALLNPSALSDSMIKELERLTPTPPDGLPAMRDCDMEVLPDYAPASYPPPQSWPAQPYPSVAPLRLTTPQQVRTVRSLRHRRGARSKLPWVVLAMAAAITAGLYFDPPARAHAKTSFVSSTTHVIAMLPKHR